MIANRLYVVHFTDFPQNLFAYSNGKQKLLGYQKLERLLKSAAPDEEDFAFSMFTTAINPDTVIWIKPIEQIQQKHPE